MNYEDPSQAKFNPYTSPTIPAEVAAMETMASRPLATRGERFLGALIDGLIGTPLVMGLAFAFAFVALEYDIDLESPEVELLSTVFGFLLGAAIFLALHGYLLTTRGQTIGKLVMKTQIVSNDDRLLPLSRLVLRRYLPLWIVVSIPGVGNFFAFANALAIFRENRKCFHDDLAGTKVVKLTAEPVPQPTYPTFESNRW